MGTLQSGLSFEKTSKRTKYRLYSRTKVLVLLFLCGGLVMAALCIAIGHKQTKDRVEFFR